MELAHHCEYRITLYETVSEQSDVGQQSMNPDDLQVVTVEKETEQMSSKSPVFVSLRIFVPSHFLDFALAWSAVYTTTITRPLHHKHSLLYIHSLNSFAKHSIHSILLKVVQDVHEVSGPTRQDSEQEGDTPPA